MAMFLRTAGPLLILCLCAFKVQGQVTPSSSEPGVVALELSARLVVVDVAVTDSHGDPVRALKQDDFMLLEGKVPQTLVHFEEHDGTAAAAWSPHTNPPGIFTNYGAVPANSPLNILLLDALNTQVQDQAFLRKQLLQYLDHVRPGTRVAIFGLNSRLVQLQGFTDDPTLLKRALEPRRAQGAARLDSPGAEQPGGEAISDLMADQAANSEISPQLLQSVASFEARVDALQTQNRVRLTLEELNQLARYLAGLPGRKNLLWFSGSFPLNVLPDSTTLAGTFAADFSMQDEYRETASLLGRSQVAVYPIDARGLMVSPVASAEIPASQARRPGGYVKPATSFFTDTAATQGTMLEMADDTGGHAFINTNALDKAVASAIDLGSHYYTLTYTPNTPATREDYRTIHIKLADAHRSDKLAYRHGYYLERPASAENLAAPPSPLAGATLTPRQAAAQFGAPPATQILFRTRVVPLAPGNKPSNSPATKDTLPPPTRTYLVQFQADQRSFARAIQPDGSSTSFKVRFVTLLYDNSGKLVNSVANTVPAALTAAQMVLLSRQGIQYRQQIAVPRHGEYTLRLLVDDMLGSRLGALEIPIAAVKDLPEENLTPPPIAR